MTRILALTALAMVTTMTLCFAGETNFKPANMSGDAPAAESTRPAKPAPSNEPGFWDREAKRSGLDRAGEMLNPANWFKKRDSSAS